MSVDLPDWPRGLYGEWNDKTFRPFDEQALIVGEKVRGKNYREGDILLMNLGDCAGHTDHIGVFINGKQFLHHPSERRSVISTFGNWWERRLRLVGSLLAMQSWLELHGAGLQLGGLSPWRCALQQKRCEHLAH